MVRTSEALVGRVYAVSVFSLVVLFSGSCGFARAGDLLIHNGFEACWSKAITESQFLEALHTAIDGQTTCVPQSSGSITGGTYSACNAMACPGGATGCPVTLRAGAFSGGFASGTSTFDATGSADPISVDVSYTLNGIGTFGCTITVSNISLGYSLDYTLQPDGNSGLYADSLDQAIMTVNNGYSVDGSDLTCNAIASVYSSPLISQTESVGSGLVATLAEPATVGESVCPLTP